MVDFSGFETWTDRALNSTEKLEDLNNPRKNGDPKVFINVATAIESKNKILGVGSQKKSLLNLGFKELFIVKMGVNERENFRYQLISKNGSLPFLAVPISWSSMALICSDADILVKIGFLCQKFWNIILLFFSQKTLTPCARLLSFLMLLLRDRETPNGQ